MINQIPKLLNLTKKIIIFDLETTGLILEKDRIVEMAYILISPEGEIKQEDIFFNPEITIPQESSAVHSITNQQIANAPFFKNKAQELFELFHDSHFSGFNVLRFDLPLLKNEFLRAGVNFNYTTDQVIDSQAIYNYMHPRTLSAAYSHYCKKSLENAHSALADVSATAEVLLKQLEKHEEIRSLDFIKKIQDNKNDQYVDSERKFFWRNGEACFSFSKHKGEPLYLIAAKDPGFLNWILSADFSPEVKTIISEALNGHFPKKINPLI